MANSRFTQFFWTKHMYPVLLDCNFVVDSTNGNGLGIRNLKGPGIANVFMHTTASFTGTTHTNLIVDGISGGTASLVVGMPISGSGIPAGTTIASITSSSAITISQAATASATVTISYAGVGSPNPAPGIIMVQLGENYFRSYGGFYGFVSPLSGTPISISGSSVLTIGNAYVIVSLGTTTQAQWVAAGVPPNETAAVGLTFIAAITGGGTGTGIVEASSVSGITTIEQIGDPNVAFSSVFPSPLGSLNGTAERRPYLFYQTLAATSSGVTTLIPTAPAAGSVIGMAFYLSNSSVIVKGE
jgi:hypothetical protein